MKNSTPRQIAISIALYATLLLVTPLVVLYLTDQKLELLTLVVIAIICFVGVYLVSLYYLRKYIYRKVKLIYKTIHRHKIAPEEKAQLVDADSHIIENVEEDVLAWANSQEEELNRYKEWAEYRRKFVGDISHELKTPIFNIQGYLDTLLEGGLDDRAVALPFLKKATKNVERLQTIVEDLGAIAQLESGTLMLDMQTFDIKVLVEEVFEDLEFKANKRKIELVFKEGAAQNFMIRADRESIRQVLINLIHNSIKYGRGGGRTKVSFYDMDRHILVEVADNGIGIPEHHIPRVFDRFYRVDKSRSRDQGGSGLGLAIVKHIIEAHQQTINLRSGQGMGSTFGFTLEKA